MSIKTINRSISFNSKTNDHITETLFDNCIHQKKNFKFFHENNKKLQRKFQVFQKDQQKS